MTSGLSVRFSGYTVESSDETVVWHRACWVLQFCGNCVKGLTRLVISSVLHGDYGWFIFLVLGVGRTQGANRCLQFVATLWYKLEI
jgi:hypothetical protein